MFENARGKEIKESEYIKNSKTIEKPHSEIGCYGKGIVKEEKEPTTAKMTKEIISKTGELCDQMVWIGK